MPDSAAAPGFPRLTYLRIKNYRALRDVELRDLTPLTVFIGPNGSGKSTVLDALAFLAEAVSGNLQQAWEKRNRFAGMRTRGQEGAIEFEVKISLDSGEILTYVFQVDERDGLVWVTDEVLHVGFQDEGVKIFYLDESAFSRTTLGRSNIYRSEKLTDIGITKTSALESLLLLRSRTGEYYQIAHQLGLEPSFEVIFSQILTSYRYIHLTDDHLKGYSDAGPREKLSANGDNLPNVLYYLHTRHPAALARVTEKLRRWVPGLADVVPEITSDERLLLRFRDAPFEKPLPAQYMSDGTMRLAALLTLLYEPQATGLLGIEEPENELHPRLLARLAEELVAATATRQLLVATHSPLLLDALEPEQVWILHRGADGYTRATRTADIAQVKEAVADGSPLGYLWTSNFFRLGDPLAPLTSADR
ncbi:ATPase [Hymenobacter aquaticus]|uniref:ATPase n=1 Tax=Hymenobacter aquaticus TaxID=1867101 RepID=A0A4Z0PVH2_9BACT|nr:AAA family ATPase [Hymenobacter aquaticus]TGE21728.1 ATPase [Hymenobacter aquaticus]